MRETEFQAWYLERWSDSSWRGDVARMRRLEIAMPDLGLPDDNLDSAYRRDQMAGVLSALERSIAALPGSAPPLALVPRSTNYAERLRSTLLCAQAYKRFCEEANSPLSQTAQIRLYVNEEIIAPARKRGDETIEIVSGEVHKAMGLSDAQPTVCHALEARKFAELAHVRLLNRFSPIGSDKPSSTIRYTFAIESLGSTMALEPSALAQLKEAFLERHPGFATFATCASFAETEGAAKRALVAEASRLLAEADGDDTTLGKALLDLVIGKGKVESYLIDWRAAKVPENARARHPEHINAAVGKLAVAADRIEAVISFVDTTWQAFREGLDSAPYAESRMIPTMVRALVDPQGTFGIRSRPTENAMRMLTGARAFANAPLARAELQRVNALAQALFSVMDEEWQWAPRDLWDVQSFIWETCQTRLPKPEATTLSDDPNDTKPDTQPMTAPTNLILYGPPGTGKTHESAREAVRLCDGEADFADTLEDRVRLMARYRELKRDNRIAFITFHQSMDYENFIEGLRPETGGEADGDQVSANTGGFRLETRPGLFREIAQLAQEAAGPAKASSQGSVRSHFEVGKRQIFKMSLGRGGTEEHIYEDALETNTISLGWGGGIDWTEHTSYEAIHARWNLDHPGTNGNDGNITQTYRFRVSMKQGDIVLISAGNSQIRAIGEITGDYTFDPEAEYPNRRAVRWLKVFDDPIAVDTIYARPFTMRSCYRLRAEHIRRGALQTLLSSVVAKATGTDEEEAPADAPAAQFVLIIDEINRANVSKVFGELITLIEPDKRLGMVNELKVRLPYSRREFGVPANLHIIGTMNTADRSIARLDTALRRRFTFRELAPDVTVPAFREAELATGLPLGRILNTINTRIEYLIDREHRIGHAFFIGCADRHAVDAVIRNKVIPLLQEFFFEDWGLMAAVLGSGFIVGRNLPAPPGLEKLERFVASQSKKTWHVRHSFPDEAYAMLLKGAIEEDDASDSGLPEGEHEEA